MVEWDNYLESIPYVDRVTQLLEELGEDECMALYDDGSYFISELGQNRYATHSAAQ